MTDFGLIIWTTRAVCIKVDFFPRERVALKSSLSSGRGIASNLGRPRPPEA